MKKQKLRKFTDHKSRPIFILLDYISCVRQGPGKWDDDCESNTIVELKGGQTIGLINSIEELETLINKGETNNGKE